MWYIYTMEYYSAIKRTMPFVATWMKLEIILLSEVRKRNTIWTLKYNIPMKQKQT